MSKIHIKPSHKGKFKSYAKAHGMTVAEAASKITKHKDEYSKHVQKMATFAQNAKRWDKNKHAFGGQVPVEVEGGEIAQEPDGTVNQYTGASHENGGVDDTVPQGTAVYSDRIAIDGKTMADRKLARERSLSKLKNAGKRRPVDAIMNNSKKHQEESNAMQERNDMIIQEVASHIYPQPTEDKKQKKAFGGKVYAYGNDGVDGSPDEEHDMNYYGNNPYFYRSSPNMDNLPTNTNGFNTDTNNPTSDSWKPLSKFAVPETSTYFGDSKEDIHAPSTIGNTIGMVGTAINAVSPLINSNQQFKNRVPNINSFANFNHDALNTNENELNTLAGEKDLALSNSSRNRLNSINRNNNSARSINTQRALNSGTDIIANEDDNKIGQGFAAQTMGVLDKRATLQTQRDSAVMGGNAGVIAANKADQENFYTNRGKDLANLGTGLQKQGFNMNQQQHNEDFLNILPLLSKYGIGISYDNNGKPKLVNS